MQWGHRELWARGTTLVITGQWLQAPRSPQAYPWCAASMGDAFPMGEVGRTHGPTCPGGSCLSLAEPLVPPAQPSGLPACPWLGPGNVFVLESPDRPFVLACQLTPPVLGSLLAKSPVAPRCCIT